MFSALAILLLAGPSLQFTPFQQGELKKHNEYRALHGAPPMTLDAQLCARAQKHADYLLANNKWEHSGSGENLYKMWGGTLGSGDATKNWYDEIKHYNFKKPGFSMKTGHFTQVVWKSSTKFCIAKATGSGETIVVANYSPAGNLPGAYPDNVLPKGRAFNQMMESLENPTVAEQKVREVFRQYDRDNNGLISAEEVIRYASEHGEKLTEQEVKYLREMIRKYDTDGDGQLNHEECLKAECYKAPATRNQKVERALHINEKDEAYRASVLAQNVTSMLDQKNGVKGLRCSKHQTYCPGQSHCCPYKNWFCCSDYMHCAATSSDCPNTNRVYNTNSKVCNRV